MARVRAVFSIVVVGVVATATACSGGSTSTRPTPTPSASAGESAAFVASTQQREQLATTYAIGLAGAGPSIPGETPLRAIPAKLKEPDQTIGAGNLITRARYWSVPGSPDSVYAALKKVAVANMRLSGYGRPGAGSNADNYADLFYEGTQFPGYLAAAELYVEILGASGGRSDIAVFAEVVPFPFRQANEVIPLEGSKVVVTRTRVGAQDRPPLRSVTLSPSLARQLVVAFNDAKVEPPATCIGGLPPPFGYSITITSQGRTWHVSWDGLGSCDGLSVRSDGQDLAGLRATPAFMRMLQTDLLGPNGYIDGGFEEVHDGGLYPVKGTVTLSRQGHVVGHFTVNQQGSYEFIVPPGNYTLTGINPQIENGTLTCAQQHTAVVRQGHRTYDEVRCRRK